MTYNIWFQQASSTAKRHFAFEASDDKVAVNAARLWFARNARVENMELFVAAPDRISFKLLELNRVVTFVCAWCKLPQPVKYRTRLEGKAVCLGCYAEITN